MSAKIAEPLFFSVFYEGIPWASVKRKSDLCDLVQRKLEDVKIMFNHIYPDDTFDEQMSAMSSSNEAKQFVKSIVSYPSQYGGDTPMPLGWEKLPGKSRALWSVMSLDEQGEARRVYLEQKAVEEHDRSESNVRYRNCLLKLMHAITTIMDLNEELECCKLVSKNRLSNFSVLLNFSNVADTNCSGGGVAHDKAKSETNDLMIIGPPNDALLLYILRLAAFAVKHPEKKSAPEFYAMNNVHRFQKKEAFLEYVNARTEARKRAPDFRQTIAEVIRNLNI